MKLKGENVREKWENREVYFLYSQVLLYIIQTFAFSIHLNIIFLEVLNVLQLLRMWYKWCFKRFSLYLMFSLNWYCGALWEVGVGGFSCTPTNVNNREVFIVLIISNRLLKRLSQSIQAMFMYSILIRYIL